MNKLLTHILSFFAQRTRHLSLVTLLLLTLSTHAQMVQYPVHVQVAMIPPYSLYMEEYSGGMRDRVVVTLINRDNEYFNLRVKLKMTIKANGLTVSTRPNIYLPAIEIDPNIPLRLTKTDLAPYFQPGNYTASGATAILRQKGMLPEGMVQFEFEVQEYNTGRTLSQTGMAMAYIVTQKPPLLNVPNNGIDVLGTNPQNISFQWTPQHSGLANVEYELIVKQLLAPNTRAETQWPYATEIFREPVRANMYYYGPAAPMLTPGYKYAWAVQAKAMEGTEQLNVFQNEGLSEIRWFYLQEQCTPAYNLTAEMNNGRVLLKWNSPPDNTKSIVQYRRIEEGVTNEWLTMGETDKSQMKQERHKEGYTYEYRIGSVCMTNTPFYDHTSIKFTVPLSDTIQNPHCGEDFVVVYKTREPLQELKPGDEVSGGGGATLYIMTVTSTTPGVFSGTAYTIMSPMWGGAKLRMTFENVTINTDYQLMDGEFVAVKNWKRPQITNLNPQKEEPIFADNQGITIKEVAFTIPDDASFMFDKSTGKIDINVNGQSIGTLELQVPTTAEGETKNIWSSTFPITVKDKDGNEYQIEYDETTEPAENGEVPLVVTKLNEGDNENDVQEVRITEENKNNYKFLVNESEVENSTYYYTLASQDNDEKINIKIIGESLPIDSLKWKLGKKEVATKKDAYLFSTTKAGNYTLTVYKHKEAIGKLEIIVCDKPSIVFDKETAYDGSFGFDNGEELTETKDYHKLKIGKTTYTVPWLGLLPDQEATLTFKFNANEKLEKDKDFKVTLKSTAPNEITIDNQRELSMTYQQLSTKNSIRIKSREISEEPKFNNPDFVYAVDNKGDTVGKINILCSDVQRQDIIFVYVQHNRNGCRTDLTVDNILNTVNQNSHNQLYVKMLQSANIEARCFDISAEYSSHPDNFASIKSALTTVSGLYTLKTGIVTPRNTILFFITDLDYGDIGGIMNSVGVGLLSKSGGVKSTCHELGHGVGLPHPFCCYKSDQKTADACKNETTNKNRCLIEGSTKNNYMDYISDVKRNMYFFYQWSITKPLAN